MSSQAVTLVTCNNEYAPRTINPRKRVYSRLPVVAIHGGTALSEGGEIVSITELVDTLPTRSPTIFAKIGAADFLGELNAAYLLRKSASWQWRVSTHEREICRPDGRRIAARVSTAVHYFGFKGGNYHKLIDPVTMYGHRLDTIWPGDEPLAVRLLQWATALRDFCDENGIEVRPTTGSIGSQFLTDKRFYPEPRRKVPAKINERTREHQPGNHYFLNVKPMPGSELRAWYLDQTRAHHYHARTTALPDANSLYAYGRFLDLAEPVLRGTVPEFYGLYCLDLEAPPSMYFGWIRKTECQFVYSNELQHLLDAGYTVKGVRAAWGSRKRDAGIARYAQWATSQLDRYEDAPWLKPLLLSTYGTLAIRPQRGDSVFRLASKGEEVTIPVGHHTLTGLLSQRPRKMEPKFANVLHRGMIEAATRSDSIGLSEYLDHLGYSVLSIYADAVIVEVDDDKNLPILPEPWRCKETLNHLEFVNQQAFISGEMTKLPGVSSELRAYQQHAPGYAPRVSKTEALTGRKIRTGNRIYKEKHRNG